MTTATWNTGRTYTAEGQLMAAQTVTHTAADWGAAPAHGIVFIDASRGLDGFIPTAKGARIDDLQAFVMHNYDHGNYENAFKFDREELMCAIKAQRA
jgi:hypothetical protein